jgi:voltage-gated sodium channel
MEATAPQRKRTPIEAACARVSEDPRFETVTLIVILANAILLGLETYDAVEDRYGDELEVLNIAFLGYFTVEILIRVVGHLRELRTYFRDPYNAFDFVVVAAAYAPGIRENATLLRVVRLMRVFRLLSVLPEMRVLVRGLLRSLAPLVSVALLTLLLFYVYGMIGWLLFADEDPQNWRTIGQAMLTLFSVLTLEEWTVVQRAALEITPWAWVYFVSFILVSSFLLLNVVIAVVINSVEDARATIAAEERRREAEALREAGDRESRILARIDELRDTLEALERELGRRDLPRL